MIIQKVNRLTLSDPSYPAALSHIHSAPKELFYVGAPPETWQHKPKVAIVGSRKMSAYGKQVTEQLAGELARAGVVIISGLALGIDAIAHQAALQAGGTAIAVLPTSLEQIYPASHRWLAQKIVECGGTLISEYSPQRDVYISNFVARNRIVSGLCDGLLITEAALKSGSLHTARFALEQGKTVMAVPGNITSTASEGCNNLIKSGALPVTGAGDIFFALGIKPTKASAARIFRGTPREQRIFELIASGIGSQEDLAQASGYSAEQINGALTMLEISGVIHSAGAGNWLLT